VISARYRLDVSARRSRDGRVLSGGQPARVLRFTAKGAAALDAALDAALATGSSESQDLLDRLVGYGLLHPGGQTTRPSDQRLTCVVPVKDSAASIGELVAKLTPLGPVIVVDDCSADGTRGEAERAGARAVANAHEPGPAGARNTGLDLVDTDLVAFVDSDCLPRSGWSDQLVNLLDDPRLALVAPRVASLPGTSAVAHYEMRCSPLDLGPQPSLVAPGRRVTFVPSAALVGRTAALRSVGGFDASLRVGEDVDLVWRLVGQDWTVRYVPDAIVEHRPRPSPVALARQRFRYGTSAATLERLHPGAAAPLHITPGTVGVWLASCLGCDTAILALAATTLPAARAAQDRTARGHAVLLRARGHAVATRHLARALTREWLPLTLLASVRNPPARRFMAAAFVLDTVVAYVSGPRRAGPPSFVALRLLDNASYCVGVWRGALSLRTPAPLLPRRVRSSPSRARSLATARA
jgi:mycofactocin system glycosyltransferase